MKKKSALVLLFTANAVSGFAQGITMMAIPWHFAQHQRGPAFNLLYGCTTFLTVFWGLYAGTLVDRFPRRRVFLATSLTQGVVVLGVAAYGWLAGLSVPAIALVFVVTFFGYQIHYPNLYAFAQEISEPHAYPRITSQIEIVGQSTSLLSGGAAAVLLEGVHWQTSLSVMGRVLPVNLHVPRWELHHLFAFDGLTYVVAFGLIAFIRYVPHRRVRTETGSLLKRLRSGFNYLRAHPLILFFGLLSFNVFVAASIQLQALLPMYVTNHLRQGGHAVGLAELTGSFGAMSAGILTRRLLAHRPVPGALIALMVLSGANFFLAGLTRLPWVFYVFSMLNGFFNSGTRILRVTYLFDHVPNELAGRVNSILGMLNVLIRMTFIFLFSQAFFGRGSNITHAYLIMGGFVLLSGGVLTMSYRKLVTE
ncbi:MAG: MFS transporter [Ferruginibacter sp.]|nr:MFS transporter [Cytophagales bacterium]